MTTVNRSRGHHHQSGLSYSPVFSGLRARSGENAIKEVELPQLLHEPGGEEPPAEENCAHQDTQAGGEAADDTSENQWGHGGGPTRRKVFSRQWPPLPKRAAAAPAT